jgi:hypothetical protein
LLLARALHMVGDFERQLQVAGDIRQRFPGTSSALGARIRPLAALGRIAELEQDLAEITRLPSDSASGSPALLIHLIAADELHAHGHPEAARRVIERTVATYSTQPPQLLGARRNRFWFAQALYRLGRLDEARRQLERLARDSVFAGRELVDVVGNIGFVAALERDTARVEAIDRWLRSQRGREMLGWNTEQRAAMQALLGHRDAALRLLRQAEAEGREFDVGRHQRYEYAPLRGYGPFEAWLQPRG